jgi:hypothetical protein
VNANNIVSGSTTGQLYLSQTANGGAGGSSYGNGDPAVGTAGAGGNASSTLSVSDATASYVTANSSASGGSGGFADGGGSSGVAGTGVSTLTLTAAGGATQNKTTNSYVIEITI